MRPPAAVTAPVVALAAFVRDRLESVSGSLTPLLARPDPARELGPDRAVLAAAKQLRTVIVGAAAPFAPTSYARTRLIRQMHAAGLLSDDEARHGELLLALDAADPGRVGGAC